MTAEQEYNTGVFAAIGGAVAAIGASAATVIDSDSLIGLTLVFSAGLMLSGGLFLLCSHRS